MSDPQARLGSSSTQVPSSTPKPAPSPSPSLPTEPRPAAPRPAPPQPLEPGPAAPRAASPHLGSPNPAEPETVARSTPSSDETSGNAHIAAIMARLDELEHKPLPAHVEVFDAIQGGLAAHLSHDQD